MEPVPGKRRFGLAAVAALIAFTAACERPADAGVNGDASGGGAGERAAVAPLSVSAPAHGATKVPIITAVTLAVREVSNVSISVTGPSGRVVPGGYHPATRVWRPVSSLAWGTAYAVSASGRTSAGRTVSTASSFTTMRRPAKLARVSSQLGDNAAVGVGMPLVVRFSHPVPAAKRDDVQRRMFVTAKPAQVGAWRWVSGTEVRYRTKRYWKSKTSITFGVRTRGLYVGNGRYGDNDLSVKIKTGPGIVMTISNKTKHMTVKRNGKVLRRIPVSLGKPKTPSSSGTMLIMQKLKKTRFNTIDELGPDEGYDIEVHYAQRITWGGEFLHAAPWSVAAQGKRNVSHGCVNMSTKNARWLFGITTIGDPVTTTGTEVKLRLGNGWTDWNIPWKQWTKGSALPVKV
ncbi:L,D-transpeptidase [Pilimelia columellifera]|uniref:Ig-like domain-containing protein n=1 Tax=Pilimelia columellifera subsp. columellifera TaxID=706583 RepID=A0ABN3MYF1_9ACTN